MPREHELRWKEGETEFADIKNREVRVLLGIGAEIPGLNLVSPYLKAVEILDASNFGNGLSHGT